LSKFNQKLQFDQQVPPTQCIQKLRKKKPTRATTFLPTPKKKKIVKSDFSFTIKKQEKKTTQHKEENVQTGH